MKFTLDEVRAVLAEADRPLSTVEVAQACRRRRGAPPRVAEPAEVRRALDQLAAVDAIVHGCRRDADGDHLYLVPASAVGWPRYWAVPEVAAQAKAVADRREEEFQHAEALAVEFMKRWEAAGGPAGRKAPWPQTLPQRPHPDATDQVTPEIGVHLSAEQLAWLIGRLQ